MKLAVFCVLAVSVCGLTAMLIQGCKREQGENAPPAETNTNAQPAETSLPPINTNSPTMATGGGSNITNAVTPAPVAPVMNATTEAPGVEYVVVQGDTLGKIAKNHGVTLRALEAANPNIQPTKMHVGQKILIPAGSSSAAADSAGSSTGGGGEIYVVKSGDTLTKIAQMHGTSVRALKAANNLTTDHIKVGDKLKIPAKTEAAPPAPATSTAPVVPPGNTSAPAPAGTPTGQ